MPSSNFTVVFDACVLYPSILRDLLVTLAKAGLFRAKWTDDIHDEWIRSLLKNRPDLSPELLSRTRRFMDSAVLDALIDPARYRLLIPSFTLPDPDDRHVLAAAVASQAEMIITFNLKDFPESALAPHGVVAEHPDAFVESLLSLAEQRVLSCIEEQRGCFKKSPLTRDELLAALRKNGLPTSVARLAALSTGI